ncbi:MAG: family 1 glycosylhydrolase [Christensenellaceae bacterium]|nr:family 1 glycosylhydrolase [Christensenellaceae bacterium]
MSFPKNFLWGAASAAYQIEGASSDDGKSPSIWDALSEGRVKHFENGNVACDHYHRYKEDVALMKQIGLKSYRFSVAWSRIIPEPGKVNSKGLAFYSNLVDELLAAGITPLCTIYHWDLPMWAHEKGGWLWEGISDAFAEYTRALAEGLGDKITHWMTINEPSVFGDLGYHQGTHAPFCPCDENAPEYLWRICTVTKNILLAHGKAVKALREHCARAPQVGLALTGTIFTPWEETAEGIAQAKASTFNPALNLHNVHWWMDPAMGMEPQQELAKYLTEVDKKIIAQPLDFMGFNCYLSDNFNDHGSKPNPHVYPGLPRTLMGWAITPTVLYWAMTFFHERWGLPMMITENGMANIDFVMSDGAVHDPQRIEYLKGYLHGVKRAVDDGIPVWGYQYWSILDNFEWAEGYDKRFGLIYVDYPTQKRVLKDSALWYSHVIATNGEEL